ncbi:MAG: PAS domain S-box protein, partial [Leptolyngbyaceae cyanobacterium MAG.088]|nr:PAS domain S-box protein [Leptolyngbyaceae cyanobacterium MAG.088]
MAIKPQANDELWQTQQRLEQEKSERLQLEAKLRILETQLTEQNSVFRQLFEKSADANMLITEGIFLRCNQAAVTMFGCKNEKQLAVIPPSNLSPERQPDGRLSSEKGKEMIMKAMEQGNHRFDWVHRRITGEAFWTEVILVPLEINGLQMLHATCRDISDRKQADAELFEQQQLLRSTYDGVEHCIVITNVLDNQDFRYVSWNPATTKRTGVTNQDVVGKTPEEVFGKIHGATIRQDYERCLAMNRSITYEEYIPFDGRDHWWLTTLNPLKDENGKIYRIVLTTFDITERKSIEATLQQKEAQYRSIFEAMNDGLVISDLTTGKTVRVNPATAKLHGYSVEEFMQLSPTDFVHPNSLAKFAQYIKTIKTGNRFTCEAADIHKDGSPIEIEVTGVPFLYNGKIHGLAIIRDITGRKASEQEQARLLAILEATSDFVGIADMEGRQLYMNVAGYH